MDSITNWDASVEEGVLKIKSRIGGEKVIPKLRPRSVAIFEAAPATIVGKMDLENAYDVYDTGDKSGLAGIFWSSAFGDGCSFGGVNYVRDNIAWIEAVSSSCAFALVPSGDSGEDIADNLAFNRSKGANFLVISGYYQGKFSAAGADYALNLESFGIPFLAGSCGATLMVGNIAANFFGLTQRRDLLAGFLDYISIERGDEKVIECEAAVLGMRNLIAGR
jgi:hypothetical protein